MANKMTLDTFLTDLSAELKQRQTMTAPASKDCRICNTFNLSDDCPHLWQSTINQLSTHYGQTKNTLRLWVSIARHRGFAVVFVKTHAGEYLHFQANTYAEAIPYFDHTDLTLRGIIQHKQKVAYRLLAKLDAGVDESQLTKKQLNARERIHLKHIITECDGMLKIMDTPVFARI